MKPWTLGVALPACLWPAEGGIDEESRKDVPAVGGPGEDVWRVKGRSENYQIDSDRRRRPNPRSVSTCVNISNFLAPLSLDSFILK